MSDKKVVCSFDRPAEYYFSRALENKDREEYLKALCYMRKAVSRNKIPEYVFQYAALLNETDRFMESFCLMMELMNAEDGTFSGEILYYLGKNLYGLGDFDKARECFAEYLMSGQNPVHCDEATSHLFFLSANESGSEDENTSGRFLEDVKVRDNNAWAVKGRQYYQQGEYEKAVKALEKITDNRMLAPRNDMAVASFAAGDAEKALKITEEILAFNPEYTDAHCTMAVISHSMNDIARQRMEVEKITSVGVDDEEIDKVIDTLCEIGEHEEVLRLLLDYLDNYPYDEEKIFKAGIAAYNTGRYGQAIRFMVRIFHLDEKNSIVPYYIGLFKKAEKSRQSSDDKVLSYYYNVPCSEQVRRMGFLQDLFMKDVKDIKNSFYKNKETQRNLIWALFFAEDMVQLNAAAVIAGFRTKDGEELLRQFLLSLEQPDSVKNELFYIMKANKIKEPYVAVMDGHVVEVSLHSSVKRKKKE